VIRLDAGTVLLQWATGGLFFLWVTARRREVGLGYSWLLHGIFGLLAVGAGVAGESVGYSVAAIAVAALGISVGRRKLGIDATFPVLDAVAAVVGLAGLVASGLDAGGPDALAVARTVVGAAFLGVVSDAMLLGHWYLVQPGLAREPLHELNTWLARVWPFEVGLLLWPTGMLSVLSGSIDDGWNGMLGWFWVACAVTTLVLAVVTRAALKERAYSAVMAATGLLYLAILTAFGTDLVARALLAG
jgi:hypothetical protein